MPVSERTNKHAVVDRFVMQGMGWHIPCQYMKDIVCLMQCDVQIWLVEI